jgi:hypothetical protein
VQAVTCGTIGTLLRLVDCGGVPLYVVADWILDVRETIDAHERVRSEIARGVVSEDRIEGWEEEGCGFEKGKLWSDTELKTYGVC